MSVLAAWIRHKPTRVTAPGYRDLILTVPNTVTCIRGLTTSAMFALAMASGHRLWLFVALAAHWLGDNLDGVLARRMRQETVFGAQLDCLVDRLAYAMLGAAVIVLADANWPTLVGVIIVWIQFGVLDQLLANQFLRFGLWSPNEFHLVDEDIWRRNWAPPAKTLSNVPAGFIALGGVAISFGAAIAAVIAVLRVRALLDVHDLMQNQLPQEPEPASEVRLHDTSRVHHCSKCDPPT